MAAKSPFFKLLRGLLFDRDLDIFRKNSVNYLNVGVVLLLPIDRAIAHTQSNFNCAARCEQFL